MPARSPVVPLIMPLIVSRTVAPLCFGGTLDASTGLTHLGAREYDPATGRFVSVDPIVDHSDPQQMHGYSYSYNNPLAFTGPHRPVGMVRLGPPRARRGRAGPCRR